MNEEIKDFEGTKAVLETFENKKEVLSVVELSPFEADIKQKKEDYSQVLQKIGLKKGEVKVEAPKIMQVEKTTPLPKILPWLGSFVYDIKKNALKLLGLVAKKSSELKISLTLLPLKTVGVKKQLVLINLPINEQITELEQIIFGLINAEFNEEELKIIKKEVEGLSVEVQKEKVDITKLSENERTLIETRNSALERALKLLKGEG
jgi:hypothetical protein